MRIYPNPSSGQVVISSELADIVEVRIFDIVGHLSQQQTFSPSQTIELDLSDLAPGVYLAQIKVANGGVTTHKIVKE